MPTEHQHPRGLGIDGLCCTAIHSLETRQRPVRALGGGAGSATDAPVRAADAGAAGRGAGDGLKRPSRPAAPHAASGEGVRHG